MYIFQLRLKRVKTWKFDHGGEAAVVSFSHYTLWSARDHYVVTGTMGYIEMNNLMYYSPYIDFLDV